MNDYQRGVAQPRESRAYDTAQAYHDAQMREYQKLWDQLSCPAEPGESPRGKNHHGS